MELGARFAKWGIGLFVLGVLASFGVIAHYCVGARWPTGELFTQNITLWWGSPWTLSVAVLQMGGLSLVALGGLQIVEARASQAQVSGESSASFWLCVVGLLGTFLVGYPGYFVFDAIRPGFYDAPVAAGKNAW